MKKIKLNLASGAIIEKPLISAFKANNNSYVILDNEMNGSMGLPIILVSKLENNRLVKILDQGEWQSVKEILKNIIAGGVVETLKLDNEITADDIYYTQLTLPVASFDALKNAYNVDDTSSGSGEVGVMDINPSETVTPEPEAPAPVEPTPEVAPVPPVEPTQVEATPEVSVTPETPNIEMPGVSVDTPNEVQNNIEPEITPTPTIETNISTTPASERFKDQKEAFMQACENMFDALVQKFEKELNNK